MDGSLAGSRLETFDFGPAALMLGIMVDDGPLAAGKINLEQQGSIAVACIGDQEIAVGPGSDLHPFVAAVRISEHLVHECFRKHFLGDRCIRARDVDIAVAIAFAVNMGAKDLAERIRGQAGEVDGHGAVFNIELAIGHGICLSMA